MAEVHTVESWQCVAVALGLGRPWARGVTAASVAALVAYAAKFPRASFRRDGSLKPWSLISHDPEAVGAHFLLIPVAVGVGVTLFT